MTRTAQELAVIAELLRPKLIDGSIQKITQPHPARILLHIYQPQHGATSLVFDVVRGHPLVQPTTRRFQNPPEVPPFCALLRKLLENTRIRGLSTLDKDRVLVVELDRKRDDTVEKCRLIAELIPTSPALLVIGPDGTVEAASDSIITRDRHIERGGLYVPPKPPTNAAEEPFSDFAPWTPEDLFSRLEAVLPDSPGQIDRRELKAAIDRDLKRQYKRIAKIEEDLRRSTGGEETATEGELLKSVLGKLKRGMNEVKVRDWMQEGEVYVTIPLDPLLSPQENLESIFKRARKKNRGLEHVEERMREAKDHLSDLTSFREKLDDATFDDAAARRDMERLEIRLVEKQLPPEKKKAPAPRRPYHVYLSKDGIEIRVGRSSADNDEVTFRHCDGNEWWLHAQDYPGSHVVVKTSDEIPEQTLLDAATLAIEYSKANSGGKQSVSYTRRKHVAKFRGAAPGKVMLQSHKTIYLRFEPERLARLESTRKS